MKKLATPIRPAGGVDLGRRWLSRVTAILVLTVGLVASVNWLAEAAKSESTDLINDSWGVRTLSYWSLQYSENNNLDIKACGLHIRIRHDSLTATYTVTAPVNGGFERRALGAETAATGDGLVKSLLGTVSVAEFRYGFTGKHYQRTFLLFLKPQLTVKKGFAILTISSRPYHLYLHNQQISISAPKLRKVAKKWIHIEASRVQVEVASGAKLTYISGRDADLSRSRQTTNLTVTEGDSTKGWTTGLRSLGGTALPVADGLLDQLGNLIFYVVLLWGLTRVRAAMPGHRMIAAVHSVVRLVVVALLAIAFLSFLANLGSAIFSKNYGPGQMAAGPLALLLIGLFMWPIMCWRISLKTSSPRSMPFSLRITSAGFARRPVNLSRSAIRSGPNRQAIDAHSSVRQSAAIRKVRRNISKPKFRYTFGFMIINAMIYSVYIFVEHKISPGAHGLGFLVSGFLVLLLTHGLVRLAIGPSRMTSWLVSTLMLIAAFAVTIFWPVLYYGGWYANNGSPLQVNNAGKYVVLAGSVATLTGVSLLIRGVCRELMTSRRWKWFWTTSASAVIWGSLLPDVWSNVHLMNSHAAGPSAYYLFYVFTLLPKMIDWLMLGLAIVAAMSLPRTPAYYFELRWMAIPIGLLLLYWNGTWLYIPVSLAVGFFVLSKLVFPCEVCLKSPRMHPPEESIRTAMVRWRRADFAGGQRQALIDKSADALRDLLIRHEARDYEQAVVNLAAAQNELAELREGSQTAARQFNAQAFSHYGAQLERESAVAGAIVGAILGVVPAMITMLTTSPSVDYSGAPVLDFFGSMAWELFQWCALGWFVGYFSPIIRGKSGGEKGCYIFLSAIIAQVPIEIIWNNSYDWGQFAVTNSELSFFLIVIAIYLCDIRILRSAKMRAIDWVAVHNWRFAVTVSTVLIAALSTALVTFLSTAATNFSDQVTSGSSGTGGGTTTQSSSTTGGPHG